MMEQETPITYWEEMYGRYENWINSFNACPVLRLDINDYDLINKPEEVESIVEKIGHSLKETSLLKK